MHHRECRGLGLRSGVDPVDEVVGQGIGYVGLASQDEGLSGMRERPLSIPKLPMAVCYHEGKFAPTSEPAQPGISP